MYGIFRENFASTSSFVSSVRRRLRYVSGCLELTKLLYTIIGEGRRKQRMRGAWLASIPRPYNTTHGTYCFAREGEICDYRAFGVTFDVLGAGDE